MASRVGFGAKTWVDSSPQVMAEPHFDRHVFICVNRRDPGNPKGSCAEKGGEAVRDEFKRVLHERGVKGRMRANAAGCLDQCARGVTVVVYPEQVWYGHVTVDDIPELVDKHLIGVTCSRASPSNASG